MNCEKCYHFTIPRGHAGYCYVEDRIISKEFPACEYFEEAEDENKMRK